jgi:hypothetical protein
MSSNVSRFKTLSYELFRAVRVVSADVVDLGCAVIDASLWIEEYTLLA